MSTNLSASARYGYGGKQFIARIKGRHPKFTFDYEFMGRKEGKRGESTSVDVDDAGLYITRDVDSKGRADDSYALVYEVDGETRKIWITKEFAMKLAKKLETSTPDWKAEGIAAEKRKAERLAEEAAEAEARALADRISTCERRIAEFRTLPTSWDSYNLTGLGSGIQVPSEIALPLYEAELARLRGEPSTPLIDRAALEAERAGLVARLAEIDAALGTAT